MVTKLADPVTLEPAVPFRFGGHAALDFVNTVNCWARPATRDYIDTFERLVGWSYQVQLMEIERAEMLVRSASKKDAEAAHGEALQLRTALHRLFGAIIDNTAITVQDFADLNALLQEGRSRQILAISNRTFGWTWVGDLHPREPILRVAMAAGELLDRGDLSRLKRCPGPDGCGWLFMDDSRNKSRRWCSMEYCGSDAKARRYAERQRELANRK